MYAVETQSKPRKLTTYGKAGRQQSFAYKSFLENSPVKRRVGPEDITIRDQRTSNSSKHSPDSTWDIPSDGGLPERATPSHSRSKSAIVQKSKPSGGELFESITGKQRTVSAQNAAPQKRKRDNATALQNASIAKDIFDFPDDGILAASLPPLPTRTRAKTPSATASTRASSTTHSRSRKTTPEPSHINRTPLTARRIAADVDIYDLPDDDHMTTIKTKPRQAAPIPASPLPARKRQKTPAREARTENKSKPAVRGRATTPQRIHPAKATVVPNTRRRNATSPRPSAINGISKRLVKTGSSAPASLWNMIREPPSPPADSSDSAASPGTPERSVVIDVGPVTAPPNRAFVSPNGVVGSVTPRQKQLWAQLLSDESTDSPSELPLSRLQLTSAVKAPSQKAVSLTRSVSDVPQTAATRRKRLVDTLKATEPIVEDDEMDVDDSSSSGEPSVKTSEKEAPKGQPPKLRSEVSFKQNSAKLTYGQGRTYLEEKNEERMWDMLAADGPSQSYSAYGSQSQGLQDEDIDMEETSQPRAAHDLRAAGSRRRLHDELTSFIMDIEQKKNSPSIRRSALRDLAEKLLKKDAATCFVESGLDSTFLKAVETDTDNVFLFLEVAVIVLITGADSTSSVLDHVFQSPTFKNIFKLLDVKGSLELVVRDRKSNIAKMSQAMMLEFRDALFEADIWQSGKPQMLTPRVLGLHCIELVVRKLCEHGSSYALLDEVVVEKMMNITRTELASSTPDMAVVERALSALQVNTISAPTTYNKIWSPAITTLFADVVPAILGHLNVESQSASQSMQLTLKLAIELTNHDTAACDILGTSAIIQPLLTHANMRYAQLLNHQAGEDYAVVFDFTVLSFGLIINLTESSDVARLAFLDNGGVELENAIKLFIRGKKCADDAESLEDTQMNVIYGCLAFSLGNMSRNKTIRKVVASLLPGGDIDMVLGAMQEFAAINQLADRKEFEGEEGHEVSRNFTERLRSMLGEVKVANGCK